MAQGMEQDTITVLAEGVRVKLRVSGIVTGAEVRRRVGELVQLDPGLRLFVAAEQGGTLLMEPDSVKIRPGAEVVFRSVAAGKEKKAGG